MVRVLGRQAGPLVDWGLQSRNYLVRRGEVPVPWLVGPWTGHLDLDVVGEEASDGIEVLWQLGSTGTLTCLDVGADQADVV